jgi:hypothetical protein
LRKAEDLIQNFLDTIGQTEGRTYTQLFRGWQEMVGERIAAHAQPVDVRGTSLVVEADHPGWVQMVMMKRTTILRQIKRRVPELTITGITVRVKSDAVSPGRAGSATDQSASGTRDRDPDAQFPDAPPPPPPSADEKEALERIPDDDMRDALRRLREDLGSVGQEDS